MRTFRSLWNPAFGFYRYLRRIQDWFVQSFQDIKVVIIFFWSGLPREINRINFGRYHRKVSFEIRIQHVRKNVSRIDHEYFHEIAYNNETRNLNTEKRKLMDVSVTWISECKQTSCQTRNPFFFSTTTRINNVGRLWFRWKNLSMLSE